MKKKQDESVNQIRRQWDEEERKKDEQIYLQDELEPKILVITNFIFMIINTFYIRNGLIKVELEIILELYYIHYLMFYGKTQAGILLISLN